MRQIVGHLESEDRPLGQNIAIKQELSYILRSCNRISLSSLVVLLWSEFPDLDSAALAGALLDLQDAGLLRLERGPWAHGLEGAQNTVAVRVPQFDQFN
jgi:hypothetical protein